MSVLDTYEVAPTPFSGNERKRKKKVIYFSDGSTMSMEEEEEEEVDRRKVEVDVEETGSSDKVEVDTKSLSWPQWLKHSLRKGRTSVMGGLEHTGETLAYHLGITSPKYQAEIDEYNRMVAQKAKYEEEAKAWRATNPTNNVHVVMDQVRPEGNNKLPETEIDRKEGEERV